MTLVTTSGLAEAAATWKREVQMLRDAGAESAYARRLWLLLEGLDPDAVGDFVERYADVLRELTEKIADARPIEDGIAFGLIVGWIASREHITAVEHIEFEDAA